MAGKESIIYRLSVVPIVLYIVIPRDGVIPSPSTPGIARGLQFLELGLGTGFARNLNFTVGRIKVQIPFANLRAGSQADRTCGPRNDDLIGW